MASTAKFTTMDAYIASFPKEVQGILEQVRQTIRKAAPGATEAISYQIPTFKLNGSNLVHFAAWKDHMGFYATPSGMRRSRRSWRGTGLRRGPSSSRLMSQFPTIW